MPTARSGLATAVILGMARAIGEASPVLLTAGFTSYMNANPLTGRWSPCPLETLKLVQAGVPAYTSRAFGCASFLLLVVIVLFLVARKIGGWGPGHLSPRAQRRVMARASARDVDRFARKPGDPAGWSAVRRIAHRIGAVHDRSACGGLDMRKAPVDLHRSRGLPCRHSVTGLSLVTMVSPWLSILPDHEVWPAGATSYVPMSGEGLVVVGQRPEPVDRRRAAGFGMRVNYTANGSTTGSPGLHQAG
jgi:hypothetical protein